MKHSYTHLVAGILLLCLLFLSQTATATHIRGGEIIARRVDSQSLAVEIIIRGYTDNASQVVAFSNGTLDFGDGTTLQLENANSAEFALRQEISENTWLYELKVQHTYPAAGTYTVSLTEMNRNPAVLNMDNSENTPFYVQSALVIDPFLGVNNTPEFLTSPIDVATSGKTYHHQPGAFDEDGDSLSYRMVQVLQGINTPVNNYRFPHQVVESGNPGNGASEGGEASIFKINPVSGDIIWDAPGAAGEYAIAFQVVEWRKVNGQYQQLGYVTRDMQILVEDRDDSLTPQLVYPISETFISPAAGEPLSWTISAKAPTANDSVVLEIWGDLLERTEATASNKMVRAKGEATITIQWTGQEDTGQLYQLIARSYYPSTPEFSRTRNTFIYYNQTEPLGIRPRSSASLTVYPNPATANRFTVGLPEGAAGKEVHLRVFDMDGQLVLQEAPFTGVAEYLVQLPAMSKGMYLVLLHYNGTTFRNKLMIQ